MKEQKIIIETMQTTCKGTVDVVCAHFQIKQLVEIQPESQEKGEQKNRHGLCTFPNMVICANIAEKSGYTRQIKMFL